MIFGTFKTLRFFACLFKGLFLKGSFLYYLSKTSFNCLLVLKVFIFICILCFLNSSLVILPCDFNSFKCRLSFLVIITYFSFLLLGFNLIFPSLFLVFLFFLTFLPRISAILMAPP